jgi:large subunit ribosomal protein L1
VGRLSFDDQRLRENIRAFIEYITALKPVTVRGTYLRGVALAATMSPGVRVAA